MSFLDTQPAPIDSDGHDDPFAQFRSSHPREVLALLRELRDGGTPVALSSPGGTGLGATVWTVDSDRGRIAFDVEPQDPQLPGLVESNELTAVAYLDSVKLQFDLHDLVLVRSPRATALQARMPACVYRFQRRSAYRVRTLDRGAPVARLRHPSLPDMQLALRILDLSIGGCALLLPDNVPPLPPGWRWAAWCSTWTPTPCWRWCCASSMPPACRARTPACAWAASWCGPTTACSAPCSATSTRPRSAGVCSTSIDWPMALQRRAHAAGAASAAGFTLLELAIALAITSLLAAMAVPSYASLIARQRLQAAVEHLRADIALARQEAGRRAQPVHLVFQPGSSWCYAIGTGPVGDCRQAQGGAGSGLIKLVRGSTQPGVQLLQANPMTIDGRTGGSLRTDGLARFASAEGQQLQVRLSALGHASVCAPAGAVAGTPPCPASPPGL
jgi:prepilin-type N-terminal cleavage/methylation domain-containing protein